MTEPTLFDEPPATPHTVRPDPNPPPPPKSTRHITRALRDLIDAAERCMDNPGDYHHAILRGPVGRAREALLASPKAQRGASDTTLAAAAAHKIPAGGPIQRNVYELFLIWSPMTDAELDYRYIEAHGSVGFSSARKRRGELADLGVTRNSGQRATFQGSGASIVWELTGQDPPWVT